MHTALLPQQPALNQADSEFGKHGDEMVALFTVLAAADDQLSPSTSISGVFDLAAQRAASLPDNLSARFYAQGLEQFASALRPLNLTVSDLAPYLKSVLTDSSAKPVDSGPVSQGQLLKALIKGLSNWDAQLASQDNSSSKLSLGYLFDLGVDYLQAVQQGATRLDAVVTSAVKNSPLKSPEFRAASGKLVLKTFLESILLQSEPNPDH